MGLQLYNIVAPPPPEVYKHRRTMANVTIDPLFVEKVSLEPHERHSISGPKLQVLSHSCCSQPTQATSDRQLVEYVRHYTSMYSHSYVHIIISHGHP